MRKYNDVQRNRIVAQEWTAIVDAPRVDSTGRPVAFVEFADYECPACRRQFTILHSVLNSAAAGGLAFRNRPLPIHAHADGAARTAICADKQGKFIEMHNRLFTTAGWLVDTNWVREAIAVGIRDTVAFSRCRTSDDTTERLKADMAIADHLLIGSTPTLVSPRKIYVGVIPDSVYLRSSASQ